MSALSDPLGPEKEAVLKKAGFIWLDQYDFWINPDMRIAISNQWAFENPLENVEEEVEWESATGEWTFELVGQIPDATRDAVQKAGEALLRGRGQ